MNLAVLMTCHNRRDKTMRCLRSLVRSTQVGIVHVFLVDDGSTDGTSEAVQEWTNSMIHHSSFFTLHLIRGGGSLYWARGMSFAWKEAARNDPDGYLWLNDDVELFQEALMNLIRKCASCPGAIVVGECCDPTDHAKKTYGLQGRWFNGNFVYVPRCVSDKIGIIDGGYSHAKADFDYAERARRAGVTIVGTEGFVGACVDDWKAKMADKTLRERVTLLVKPGYWNLSDLWRFQVKYYGRFRAALCCLKLIAIATRGVR